MLEINLLNNFIVVSILQYGALLNLRLLDGGVDLSFLGRICTFYKGKCFLLRIINCHDEDIFIINIIFKYIVDFRIAFASSSKLPKIYYEKVI